MGQCYSINCKLKFKDIEDVRLATCKFVNETDCEWHKTKEEISKLCFEELLKMFLYEIEVRCTSYKNGNLEMNVASSFNQSYMWESLLLEWFESISGSLCNGSFLTVYPDEDYDRLVIKNGECVQTH